jgi:hypothetical protein
MHRILTWPGSRVHSKVPPRFRPFDLLAILAVLPGINFGRTLSPKQYRIEFAASHLDSSSQSLTPFGSPKTLPRYIFGYVRSGATQIAQLQLNLGSKVHGLWVYPLLSTFLSMLRCLHLIRKRGLTFCTYRSSKCQARQQFYLTIVCQCRYNVCA